MIEWKKRQRVSEMPGALRGYVYACRHAHDHNVNRLMFSTFSIIFLAFYTNIGEQASGVHFQVFDDLRPAELDQSISGPRCMGSPKTPLCKMAVKNR